MHFLSPENITNCNWYEFERYIYRVLQHSGWKGLIFTGRSNDKGADIVGEIPKGKGIGVVQCKHTGSSTIGRNGVDDLQRACDFYGTGKGILATNAKLSTGARNRINELANHYTILVWDFSTLIKIANSLQETSIDRKDPRPYQEEAINDVINEFNQGSKTALVVFATGLGKSMVLSELCVEFCENRALSVLLLADRTQLIEQLESSLWPQIRLQTETRLWDGDRKPSGFNGITVATQQSVYNHIKNGLALPHFGLVLVDECHHAAAYTYRDTLALLDYSHLLGVTATPWRGDEQPIESIFGEPLRSMGLVEGIKKGYLSDVDYTMYLDDIDWEKVSMFSKKSMTVKDLNASLFVPSRDDDLCKSVIAEWIEESKPLTITFCRSIDHAIRLAELLTVMGMPSRAIHSRNMTKAEQSRLLMLFRAGEFSNLISVDILNEGIDVPDVGMVVFARVTHSRRIFVQQLGRGLRVTASKSRVKVLDFVADIRRVAEGFRVNREARECADKLGQEVYRGKGAEIVNFTKFDKSNFVDEYLSDVADLGENEKVNLDFLVY